jgi:hypothetical protein
MLISLWSTMTVSLLVGGSLHFNVSLIDDNLHFFSLIAHWYKHAAHCYRAWGARRKVLQLRALQRTLGSETPDVGNNVEAAAGTSLSSPFPVRWEDTKSSTSLGPVMSVNDLGSISSSSTSSSHSTSSNPRAAVITRTGGGAAEVSESSHHLDDAATAGHESPKQRRGVNSHIDTQSMLKAAQTMSKEMKLDRALIALMNILIASSGWAFCLAPLAPLTMTLTSFHSVLYDNRC